MIVKCLRALAAAVLLTSIVPVATSANSAIRPVLLEVDPSGRASVSVSNLRNRPVTFVVEPLSWTVEGGQDVYSPTDSFIASPPSFRLMPGQEQTIRIGYRGRRSAETEQTFRLKISEVPSEVAEAEGAVAAVVLTHMIPVFVAPADPSAQPNLRWTMRAEGGDLVVRAENSGRVRGSVSAVGFGPDAANENQPAIGSADLAHVLAGTWREWRLEGSAGASLGQFVVKPAGPGGTFAPASISRN